jgi:Putative zinc-finger
MLCRDFEERLERLVTGGLDAADAARCRTHATECATCGELLELASLGAAPGVVEAPPDLVSGVLERTTGGGCAAAEAALCAWSDGAISGEEGRLLAGHLAHCPPCRGLVAALAGLRRDLPRLAILRPEGRFVDDVLRRTLPVSVQLRRWWRAAWPRWVHRPRFASEAAFIGLLVLLLVFATPGSPLEAVPRHALALAQEPVQPREILGPPLKALEEGAVNVAETLRESEEARAVAARYEAAVATGERLRGLAVQAGERLGTLWHEAASLLEKGDNEPATQTEDSSEETS